MTKKDFVIIARILREIAATPKEIDTAIAILLLEDKNPHFRVDTFRKAASQE